uniref:hypothetical protein n=1 Tax=Fodinicola feengrottensis TaxID=435914 RepID=UPI002442E234|nr:hypothetical protein [Fodinicola feengrottensis]
MKAAITTGKRRRKYNPTEAATISAQPAGCSGTETGGHRRTVPATTISPTTTATAASSVRAWLASLPCAEP